MNLLSLASTSGRLPVGLPGASGSTTVVISNVSGTVASGNTLTLTGLKLWDQVTTGWDPFFTANASGFEGANAAADGYAPSSADQAYDSTVKLMGSKSMKCIDAGFSDAGSHGGSPFDFVVDISNAQTNIHAYWRVYSRFNANEWPTLDMKFLWLGGGSKAAFLNFAPNSGAAPTQMAYLATDYNGGAFNNVNIPGGAIVNDDWYLFEFHVMRVGASSPVLELWVDNQLLASVSSVSGVSPNPGGWGFEIFTNWWATTSGFDFKAWLDGFVISNTGRVGPACCVEIGDNATYASATKVYQRPKTTISDTSVDVKCNLTGLGGGPYYMWATNSQGVRSNTYAL